MSSSSQKVHEMEMARGSIGGSGDSLPPELLALVGERLYLLAGVSVIVWSVALLLGLVWPASYAYDIEPSVERFGLAVNLVAIVVSVGVAWVARKNRNEPAKLTTLGEIFGVLTAFMIALSENLVPYGAEEIPRGLSWVCVFAVLMPMIVPARPRRALVVAALCLAMPPAVQGSLTALGYSQAHSDVILMLAIQSGMAFVMVSVPVSVIYRVSHELQEARRLGSYELKTLLGEGGMGEVWTARHVLMTRPAAVKLIRPESLGPTETSARVRARFSREAQSTSVLRSPHTLQVYDFGVTGDGTFYYVMELLDGINLQDLVERFGPVDPRRAVDFLVQACHSLDEAHQSGLVHRDIKPANLMTCRYGNDFDFLKVLDFGLVKRTLHSEGDAINLTADGVMTGTPAFIAPETVAGDEVDGRADLYSLGCVGYWLLSGCLVFEGESPMAVAIKHATEDPTPLTAITELDVPPGVANLIMQCLSKDPAERPQSASALRAALLDAVGERWTEKEARSWWRHHIPDLASTAPASRALIEQL